MIQPPSPPLTGEVVAPHWAQGCELCRFGLINPPKTEGFNIDARRTQYINGELTFCDCAAGRAYAKYLGHSHMTIGEEIAQAQKLADERRRSRIFANAGVPRRYEEYTFGSYAALAAGTTGKEKALAAVRYYHDHGQAFDGERTYPGLFLWGEPGVGKTGALSPLFVQLIRNGQGGLWIQYNDLMAGMRNFEDGNVDQRMHDLKTCDVLFIDDFGDPAAQRMATDYSRDVVFRIVDYRANHFLPMLITSNLGPQAVVDQFHARIARRLADACLMVKVAGPPLGAVQGLRF